MMKIDYRRASMQFARWSAYRPSVVPLARLLTVLSLVMVAFSLAQLTWLVIPYKQTTLPAVSAPRNLAGAIVTSPPLQFSDMHLFGQPQSLPGSAVNAPETTLDLTLRGIIAIDKQRVIAIIDLAGNEASYKVGDTLPNGVILKEILATRVILERGGRFETLSLPKDALQQGGLSASSSVGQPSGKPQLGQLRDRLRSNPTELLGLSALQPISENGKLKGYQLMENPYMPTLAGAGLKAGDMVTRINGIPVSDQARITDIMSQLSAARQINVELERGGSPISLTLDLSR